MIRRPVVAGSFYPGSQKALEQELNQYIHHSQDKQKVIGLVSPHAGYIYSAGCAGKGFGKVQVPDTIIILGVNHRGMGHPMAVDGHEYWNTPLGDIAVDIKLGQELVNRSDVFAIDNSAGTMEHSLEVQVPFVQYLNPNARILPIIIGSTSFDKLMAGGNALGQLLKGRDDILIVASTDMSHYIDAETAKTQDQKAIDRILAMDPAGLFNTVVSKRISMCGMAPTAMMLTAAIEMGASTCEMIDYTNSGEVSGDFQQVVAYVSMMVY